MSFLEINRGKQSKKHVLMFVCFFPAANSLNSRSLVKLTSLLRTTGEAHQQGAMTDDPSLCPSPAVFKKRYLMHYHPPASVFNTNLNLMPILTPVLLASCSAFQRRIFVFFTVYLNIYYFKLQCMTFVSTGPMCWNQCWN